MHSEKLSTARIGSDPGARWRIELFGTLRASQEDRVVTHFRTQRVAALLAYLAYHLDRSHPREKLIDLLWPDSDLDSGRHNLNQSLFTLRRLLEPGTSRVCSAARTVILTDRFSVRLNPAVVSTDVAEFEAALQSAETAASDAERAEWLTRAVALYGGELLPGFYEDWIPLEQERQAERYLRALDDLVACLERADEWERALPFARRTIEADPLDEARHRQFMSLLVRAGWPAAALRHYGVLERVLQQGLNEPPSEASRRLAAQIREQCAAVGPCTPGARDAPDRPAPPAIASPPPSPEHSPGNLPRSLTSFIGREPEMAEIRSLLTRTALLTLTGAGGCGKTRLALEVAAGLRAEYPDGIWLVELAPLADPALVPPLVASILGAAEEGRPVIETLTDHLKPRSLLLILDNCEHLLDACAGLTEALLRACPRLRILATSREGLGIAGETTYRVPPLRTPLAGVALPAEALLQYEAVRLFVERAQAALPSFTLTRRNAAPLIEICHRLDGIPLALELAGTRVKVLSLTQIAARLGDRFRLLTGGSRTALPRHQTLRALVDWSYDLLSEPERVLLRRLSVFAGGWTLDAAEAICSEEGSRVSGVGGREGSWSSILHPTPDTLLPHEVLDLLVRLVEKSLVVVEETPGTAEPASGAGAAEAGEPERRYRLLETVRQYARERLEEAGEAAAIRDRHLDFFVGLAEEAEPELDSTQQAAWLDRLAAEHANLRAALEWCQGVESASETALRLAGALARFWYRRGHFNEGWQHLRSALEQERAPTLFRARALDGAAWLVGSVGDNGTALALSRESLAIWRTLGDRRGIARALNTLGNMEMELGDYGSARAWFEESLGLWRELGEQWRAAGTLTNLGLLACRQGDWATARESSEESLALFRDLGDRCGIPYALYNLGVLACFEGDLVRARALHEQSLALSWEVGDRMMAAYTLHELAHVAGLEGSDAEARARHAESLLLFQELGEKEGIAQALEGFADLAARDGCLRGAARAARLMGAAAVLWGALHSPLPVTARAEHERAETAARAALGEAAFAAAWAAGQAIPLEQAVRVAIEESEIPTAGGKDS